MAGGTQEVVEGQMLTLKFDVYALLTTKESTDFKNRGKFGASAAGSKRELPHPDALETELSGDFMPLATFAWNQRWHTLDSYSLSMYGRFLRIGLTFCNEHITDQVTTLVAGRLQDEQKLFYQEFLDSAADDWSAALCLVPRAMQFAVKCVRAARQDADTRRELYPASKQLKYIADCRATQEATLEKFLDIILKRITHETKDLTAASRPQCTVLMWQEFFGGWMPASFSPAHCDEVQYKWRGIQQSGRGSAGSGSSILAGVTSTGGAATKTSSCGASGASGGSAAGGTTQTTPAVGFAPVLYEFRHTIPTSIDIVGDTLGVKCAVTCRQCKPAGRCHPHAECPKRWYNKVGSVMPGFHPDGSRDNAMWWKSKEPIKSTVQAWIALIKDHSNWNGKPPVPAGVPGAARLEDFERRLKAAPEKP